MFICNCNSKIHKNNNEVIIRCHPEICKKISGGFCYRSETIGQNSTGEVTFSKQ